MRPFQGVLIGGLMFLASFGVLYWNEGRVDMSNIAKRAEIIQAENVTANAEHNGLLVSASGIVQAEPLIGDDLYLQPGAYFAVAREVEVYAWVENEETVTRSGGESGSNTTTEYTYAMDWVDSPADSSKFKEPTGHENPTSALSDLTTTVASARVGQYSFTPEVVQLPRLEPVRLSADKLSLTANASLVDSEYVYVRESATGTYATPQLGDLRISYTALPVPFEGTVFGKLDGTTIDPFVTKNGKTFYRVFNEGHDESVARLHSEYTTVLWVVRAMGLMLMWFGLLGLMGPLHGILGFVPILGGVGRAALGLFSLAVALVLSIVTIIISALLHNLLVLAIVIGVLVAAFLAFGKYRAGQADVVTPTV